MSPDHYTVRLASWDDADDREAAIAVRRAVFVVEQSVPEEHEIDGLDGDCRHVLAVETATGRAIGTARLMPEGRIGRVAVLAPWRKRGVGAALLRPLIAEAGRRGQGAGVLHLHAQTWTIGFYESLGFAAEGDEFDEAGIPHRHMVLRGSP